MPAPMIIPDPRAFALYKIWLSNQDDREPIKKQRDRGKVIAAGKLVVEHLPQYRFDASELRMSHWKSFKRRSNFLTCQNDSI